MFQRIGMLIVICIFLGFVDFVSATVFGEANNILQIFSVMLVENNCTGSCVIGIKLNNIFVLIELSV